MKTDPLVEAAAQAIHAVRHRAGMGHVCGTCREYAQLAAMIYQNQIHIFGPSAVDGWKAAREYYGTVRIDDAVHGPECMFGIEHPYGTTNVCSCDRAAQEIPATRWMMDYKRPRLRDTWMGSQLHRR